MFPTDLTDSAWQVIQEILADKRKRKYSLRAIFNALLYITKTGSQWRQMPNERFIPLAAVLLLFLEVAQ